MPEPPQSGKKLRWILLAAFGGMLLLMAIAGIDALRSLRKLSHVSQQVAQHYSAQSHALQTVLISFHVYDYELERFVLTDVVVANVPNPSEIATHGAEVHTALHLFPQDCTAQEKSLLAQIEQAVSREESAFNGAQVWPVKERVQRRKLFLNDEIIPTRSNVMALASAVAHLHDKQMSDETNALTAQFLGLQNRLSRMVALSLLAGLLLSLVAGYYILRLEQSGRRRYLALAQSRQALESLSRRMLEVQEAERLAISRELHDEVGQTLGALLVDLGQLSNYVSPQDTLVKDQIARIKSAAESAVTSIRDMALLLRPPMLDDLGLIPALEWQARETSRRSDMEVDVDAGELPANLPDRIKTGIYRLVQEALQNAATHAHAKNARVSVKHAGEKVEVEISDDGIGFQPDRTRGMGILGMEERVRQLGGMLDLRSAPGKGTTVHAVLPLDDQGSH